MGYNRHRKRARYRRQYTFTKTKAVIGFVISACLSILLSTVVETYQHYAYRTAKLAVTGRSTRLAQPVRRLSPATAEAQMPAGSDKDQDAAVAAPAAPQDEQPRSLGELEQRLNAMKKAEEEDL